MAFGISFGSSKKKGSSTTTIDKTEAVNQQQTGTTETTGTTSTSSTQTGSSQGQTSQSTSSQGTSSQTGTAASQTQQRSSQFSDPVLASLESTVQGLLDNPIGGATINDFNAQKFVEGNLASARSSTQSALEDNLNQLVSGIGGSASGNSAVALLSNRLRGDAAANLSGVEANLNAQANEILRQNALAGSQIDSNQQSFLVNLVQALKGGTATATGTEQQQTQSNTAQQQTGTTVGTESQQTQQSASSTQTQQLLEAINQLLTGTTHTTGTETTKTKGKTSGGGLSLSL